MKLVTSCLTAETPRKLFRAAALLLWCMYATGLLGQGPSTDNAQTIRGTVVNSVTHDPVVRALVSSPDNRFAQLTDNEGHFEFTIPKADNNAPTSSPFPARPGTNNSWLTARKPGFLNRPNESGQVQAVPGADLTISIVPESVIKGRVTLSTNEPASGLTVQSYSRQVSDGILRWQPGPQTVTNSEGEFRFAELSPGSYKLVTHELLDNDPAIAGASDQVYGFPPVYYPGVADFAAAAVIQLTAGQTTDADFSITRQPYFSVSIPVANAERGTGLNVVVSVMGHRGPGYSLGYRADRGQIEGLLPNGNYLVEAIEAGQSASMGSANLTVAGAPAEGSALTLVASGSIRLHVAEEFSDANNNQAPRASLNARAVTADDFSAQREQGMMENLFPGRYWLLLSPSRGYVAAASVGGVDALHQPVSVGAGGTTPVEVTLRDDVAQLDGTVADSTASPSAKDSAATAFVYCVPLADGPGQFRPLRVTPNGKFNGSNMAPGAYRVMAFRTPQTNLPYRDPEAMRAYESLGQVITLAPGQKATIQLQPISNDQ